MATSNNIQSPTPTPQEWQAWQNVQRAAQAFFRAPEGPAGKPLVGTFQSRFNTAIPAIQVIIRAQGGDPAKSFSAFPKAPPLVVDSNYGPNTNIGMALVVLFSFPANVASKAVAELATAPITRSRVATWARRWSEQIHGMVAPDYGAGVMNAQEPVFTPVNAADRLRDLSSSQSNTERVVDDGKSNVLEAPTDSTTAQPIQTLEPEVITATTATSYAWVWWTLGLGGFGGALWWFFGKRKRA